MSFKKNVPNMITAIRIIAAIIIIFLKPLSVEFYIVYGACGATDALDGVIARKFNLQSKFGSVLDSISDLLFLGIMAIRIIPTLLELLPLWNWILYIVPFCIQMAAYVVCAVKFRKFSTLHTYSNKALGVLVFLYPFTLIGFIPALYLTYGAIFGVIAIYASVETNLIHIISDTYDESNKAVFIAIKKKNASKKDEQ